MKISQKSAAKALSRRVRVANEVSPFVLEDFLFPEQLAFVRDPSPNKVAMCSRRSGKTISCAADLIKTALDNPNMVCLYITLSRNNAKKIIWKEIRKINKAYKLLGEESLSELSFTFPNGSMIYLSGAKDLSEIEKFRGLALKLVYIDEAQSFRSYIKELVNESLGATLLDHSGTVCMIGTPPPAPNGFFIDAFQNTKSSWSKHSWTFFNNPFLTKTSKKTHEEMLQVQLDRRGVDKNDPSIRREFYGECVIDTNSLLIHYDNTKNGMDHLPKLPNNKSYTYLLGADIGFNDADAIAILAWSDLSPNIYLVEEQIVRKQDITGLMQMIEAARKKYDISKLVIDAGALGKKITEELIRRHQIPLQPADKTRKMENIALLNDFLRTGRFKAANDSVFAKESFLVEIDRDKSTPDKIKVSDRYHSDIIDAVLYAFKECYAYTYTPQKETPLWGTKAWQEAQSEEMWEKAQNHHNRPKSDSSDPYSF